MIGSDCNRHKPSSDLIGVVSVSKRDLNGGESRFATLSKAPCTLRKTDKFENGFFHFEHASNANAKITGHFGVVLEEK